MLSSRKASGINLSAMQCRNMQRKLTEANGVVVPVFSFDYSVNWKSGTAVDDG